MLGLVACVAAQTRAGLSHAGLIQDSSACSWTDSGSETLLTVSAGRGCTLNEIISWSAQERVKVTFDIKFCYHSGSTNPEQCTGWNGAGGVDEHGFFEPFRSYTNPSTTRETPDMWWISRSGDYGYGMYAGFNKGGGYHRGTDHNPNEWHTWEVVFYNPGYNQPGDITQLYVESWTVDGETEGHTAAYQGAFAGNRGTSTSALGFAGYSGTTTHVRNLAVNYAAAGMDWLLAAGDPHLMLPHGGKADFRGEHRGIYNFLSANSLSLNVMTELADFELHSAGHKRHKDVHGSFITQAHVVARTRSGRMMRISFWASMIGELNMAWANFTVDDSLVQKIGANDDMAVEDILLHTSYSSLSVTTPEFEITVTPNKFQSLSWERNVVGLTHQLDVGIKARVTEDQFKVAPHGIVGQGWDGDGKAIDGELDAYPDSGEFTTYAMAKGAIEGTPNDYKVATPYATGFKFSRFDATSASPRDVAALVATGELNKPKLAKFTGHIVGSTEYNFTEV